MMKKFFYSLSMLIMIALWSQMSITMLAQTSNSTFLSCQPDLKKFLDAETNEYMQFMAKHMQSKKSASELSSGAKTKYHNYRAKLQEKKSTIAIASKQYNNDEAVKDYQTCVSIIDGYLKAAAANYKRTMIGNAERKQTIRMAERVRDINNKLDGLNKDVGSISGLLKTFAQKVPCYVLKCPPI